MDRVAEETSDGSIQTTVKDESYHRELQSLFRELRSHASSNIEYFREPVASADGETSNKRRLFEAFCLLREHIDRGVQPGVEYLISIAHCYDVDALTMANGYRSFVVMVERCCQRLLSISRLLTFNASSDVKKTKIPSQGLELVSKTNINNSRQIIPDVINILIKSISILKLNFPHIQSSMGYC